MIVHARLMVKRHLVAPTVAACAALVSAPAWAAVDAVQYSVTGGITAGAMTGSVTVATVPAGKRLVITAVSYYHTPVASGGSIGQAYLATTVGGVTGYYALPEAKVDGALYPGSTLTGTFYADAGTPVIANFYTNLPSLTQEGDRITLTGYLIAQ